MSKLWTNHAKEGVFITGSLLKFSSLIEHSLPSLAINTIGNAWFFLEGYMWVLSQQKLFKWNQVTRICTSCTYIHVARINVWSCCIQTKLGCTKSPFINNNRVCTNLFQGIRVRFCYSLLWIIPHSVIISIQSIPFVYYVYLELWLT